MSKSFQLRTSIGAPARVVTILPGKRYDAGHPMLHYQRDALLSLGWTVRVVEWTGTPGLGDARAAAAAVLDGADAPDPGATHIVVAQSIGTVAMPVAAKLQLPGVWIAPLLDDADAPEVREAATVLDEDHLLIGGTADPRWDHDLVTSLRADYVEVPHADHFLEIPDDWRHNLETIEDLTAEIEHFAASFDVD